MENACYQQNQIVFSGLTLTYLGETILAPPWRFFNGASIPLKISHSSFMTFWIQVTPDTRFDTNL